MKKLLLLTLISAIWIIIMSLSKPDPDCNSVHKGRFFQYKNGNQLYSTIIREDSVQLEINNKTGDTSYWKIQWTDSCTFTTRYISGLKPKTQLELEFYQQSIVVIKIKSIEQSFFTYESELKFKSLSRKYNDTAWRRIK